MNSYIFFDVYGQRRRLHHQHAFYWNSDDAREAASETSSDQGLAAAAENFGIRV